MSACWTLEQIENQVHQDTASHSVHRCQGVTPGARVFIVSCWLAHIAAIWEVCERPWDEVSRGLFQASMTGDSVTNVCASFGGLSLGKRYSE